MILPSWFTVVMLLVACAAACVMGDMIRCYIKQREDGEGDYYFFGTMFTVYTICLALAVWSGGR